MSSQIWIEEDSCVRLQQKEVEQQHTAQLQVDSTTVYTTYIVTSNRTVHPVDHVVIHYIYSLEANFS
jgi:hypothetical protein